MRAVSFESPAEFQEAAWTWLAVPERRNNLILSIVRRAGKLGEAGRGWVILSDGQSDSRPEIALFQTPGFPAAISDGSVEGAEWAARLLPADLPGVVGPSAVADAFASEWRSRTHGCAEPHMEMIFYTLDRVEPFRAPGGGLRRATIEDLDALKPLAIAAAKDMNLTLIEQQPEEVEKRLRRNIAGARQFLWTDGESIQAIAGYGEPLENAGARIGMVYTPPALRGRGYGTAITGSLAQLLLNEGQAWVSLFTDNANPVSNGIYQRLGFRPEMNYRTWLFTSGYSLPIE